MVIGSGGSTIKWICRESGCKLIRITPERIALIKGFQPEALVKATEIINGILSTGEIPDRAKTQLEAHLQQSRGNVHSTGMGGSSPRQPQQVAAHGGSFGLMPANDARSPQHVGGEQIDVNKVYTLMMHNFDVVTQNLTMINSRLTLIEARVTQIDGGGGMGLGTINGMGSSRPNAQPYNLS